jgi:uncharacterized protein (DUF58 family)
MESAARRIEPQQPAVVRRQMTLTREGGYWLLTAAGLWLTGWLKGINLILLLSYLLMLLWGMNWFAAWRSLRGVAVRRTIRDPIFAGSPVGWELEVSVSGRRAKGGWQIYDEGAAHSIRWPLLSKPNGEPMYLRREVSLPRRGPYECRRLRAVSSYPFGLVRREVVFAAEDRLNVLPRLGRIHLGRLRRWLMHSARPDERARRSRKRLALEAEFHGLRQFRPGDSPRWIHWRTSARTGELVVREFDHGTHYDLVLIVDPFASAESSEAVEAAVSLAATICWTWVEEAGDRVMLVVAGPRPAIVTGGDGPDATLELLETLAEVKGSDEANWQELVRLLQVRPLPAGPVLMVSSRPDRIAADAVERLLRRPVAFLDATAPPSLYQPPA